MSNVAIKVEGLGKRYKIGARQPYFRLSDLIYNLATTPFRTLKSIATPQPPQLKTKATPDRPTTFWALKDVAFEVPKGEVVGIIGRNGAGKSTLLKILSRITEPTEGRVEIRGRIGSLLEVGTGFHPELTGRENIFLNGAILGMKRFEIARRFDEIVAFAETEQFLDTPVKHYSSGMYMRLAFAVAAHLEPEILIVDEVLAVGDAEFQKKCLGKMSQVAQSGRTILFVSHNLAAIRSLCSRVVMLQYGKVLRSGDTESILAEYANQRQNDDVKFPIAIDPDITINQFEITQNNQHTEEVDSEQPFQIYIDFTISRNLNDFRIGVFLNNANGVLSRSLNTDWNQSQDNLVKGNYTASLSVDGRLLMPGQYSIQLHASRFGIIDYSHTHEINLNLSVHPSSIFNRRHAGEKFDSAILIGQPWVMSGPH